MIAVTNRAAHIRHRVLHGAGNVLLAVFETNYKDPRTYAGKLLDDFASETMARLGPLTSDSIGELVESASSLLCGDYRRKIGATVFAALLAGSDHADVCTAGDLRVHLVDETGAVVNVTRDHNAVSDNEDNTYTEARGMEWVLTRALPTSNTAKSPEYVRWDRPAGSRIVVCSSLLHQFRDPSAYLPSLHQVDGSVGGVPDMGFAAIIARA